MPRASCYCPKCGSFQERSNQHVLQLQWECHLLRQGAAQGKTVNILVCVLSSTWVELLSSAWEHEYHHRQRASTQMWLQPIQPLAHKVFTCHDILLSFWSFPSIRKCEVCLLEGHTKTHSQVSPYGFAVVGSLSLGWGASLAHIPICT